MNFPDMPELHTHFGYPAVVGITVVICCVMWWRLKKAGWL
jgi:magnesium transporter